MDVVMTALWVSLCAIAFLACLKNPGKLYIYAATGFLAAAFMAFFEASQGFQILLGILVLITAMIFGEASLHLYFFVFLIIDLVVILIYFFLLKN